MLEVGQIRINHNNEPFFYPTSNPSQSFEMHDGDEVEYEHGPNEYEKGTLHWNGSWWECLTEYGKFGPLSVLNTRMEV